MANKEGDAKRPLPDSPDRASISSTAAGPGKRPRAASPTPNGNTPAAAQHTFDAASTATPPTADSGRGRRGRGRGGFSSRGGGTAGRSGGHSHAHKTAPSQPASACMSLFTELGVALDDMHDRRERVVKTSRDITIGSKRVISLLHRVAGAGGEARADLLIQARQKIGEVATLFRVVGPDLRGNDFDKHHRSIAPGLEEFIEAVSFQRFIEKGDLISRCDIQRLLVDDDDDNNESHGTTDIITIPDEDYILGLADLTGELMRLAINSVAKGEIALVDDICRFLRDLTNDYEVVNFPPARKKMSTMRASLAKVEKACYAIKVRSAEYPPEKIAEMLAMGFGTGEDPRDGEESPRGESSWNDS